MNHGSIDLTTEDIERLAAEVWDAAAKEALAKGLPVTGYHDGYLFRYQPGKGIEVFAPAVTDGGSCGDTQGRDIQDGDCPGDRACDAVPEIGTGVAADAAAAIGEGGDARESGIGDDRTTAEAVEAVVPAVCAPASVTVNGHSGESLTEIGIKAIEFARQNANATLELTARLFAAKTFAQVVALATVHACKQLQAFSPQSYERAERASEPAADAVVPSNGTPPRRPRRNKAAPTAGSEAAAP